MGAWTSTVKKKIPNQQFMPNILPTGINQGLKLPDSMVLETAETKREQSFVLFGQGVACAGGLSQVWTPHVAPTVRSVKALPGLSHRCTAVAAQLLCQWQPLDADDPEIWSPVVMPFCTACLLPAGPRKRRIYYILGRSSQRSKGGYFIWGDTLPPLPPPWTSLFGIPNRHPQTSLPIQTSQDVSNSDKNAHSTATAVVQAQSIHGIPAGGCPKLRSEEATRTGACLVGSSVCVCMSFCENHFTTALAQRIRALMRAPGILHATARLSSDCGRPQQQLGRSLKEAAG